jgi:hypothetical protein
MAAIKQKFLDDLQYTFREQGVTSVTGTYDGVDGQLTYNFSDGDIISHAFKYDSVTAGLDSVSGFRELLFRVGGVIIQDYNSKFPKDTDYFIAAVTE